ncbi:MAG TPA: hypothetical protein VIL86_12775 [Tepidisphaeraceae bacterium]|jgi:hypothetical protein
MTTEMLTKRSPAIPVAKSDLMAAWSLLEKLAVSLRKIGSAFAIPQGQTDQTPEQHQAELEALDQFFTSSLMREIANARKLLVQYLPGQELEELSEHEIGYWNYQDFMKRQAKKHKNSAKQA